MFYSEVKSQTYVSVDGMIGDNSEITLIGLTSAMEILGRVLGPARGGGQWDGSVDT